MKDLRERERERERVKWVTGPYGYETVGSYSTLINIVVFSFGYKIHCICRV